MSLDALLKIADAIDTALLAFLSFMVYRIYSNHLPHMEMWLRNISERVSRLEGRDDVRLD